MDIRLPGGPQVEVKSAAYLQEWSQSRPSAISFSIAPAEGWNAVTGEVDPARLRRADVYVFCLLKHQDKATLDPLDLAQWIFYVLPTPVLNERRRDQRTLTLSSLLTLDPVRTDFGGLRDAVLALNPHDGLPRPGARTGPRASTPLATAVPHSLGAGPSMSELPECRQELSVDVAPQVVRGGA
ncbi:hypothetical protein SAVIM338S_06915 [Streptomyces avidinii]